MILLSFYGWCSNYHFGMHSCHYWCFTFDDMSSIIPMYLCAHVDICIQECQYYICIVCSVEPSTHFLTHTHKQMCFVSVELNIPMWYLLLLRDDACLSPYIVYLIHNIIKGTLWLLVLWGWDDSFFEENIIWNYGHKM